MRAEDIFLFRKMSTPYSILHGRRVFLAFSAAGWNSMESFDWSSWLAIPSLYQCFTSRTPCVHYPHTIGTISVRHAYTIRTPSVHHPHTMMTPVLLPYTYLFGRAPVRHGCPVALPWIF